MSKDDTYNDIRDIYYDADTVVGRIAETFKGANNTVNSIAYNDVKDFLEKKAHIKAT